jgi:hypothetical protein
VEAQAAAAEQFRVCKASLAADDAAEIELMNDLRNLRAKKSRTETRLKASDAILKVAAQHSSRRRRGGKGKRRRTSSRHVYIYKPVCEQTPVICILARILLLMCISPLD